MHAMPVGGSTIDTPKNQRVFLTNVSWLLDTRKDAMKSISSYVLVREGLLADDVGVAKGTVFQEIRPRAGFKSGDFVEQFLEGLP